jgi:hypothetical protein
LYRISSDFYSSTGQSRLALYTEGELSDGSYGQCILGFQSFVQRAQVDAYDLEGEHLKSRLELGQAAFYGAFQVPEKMMGHKIV